MKAILRAALLSFLFATLQPGMSEVRAQSSVRPNSLEEGSWALLFQIPDVPALDFFEGFLAMKYHLSEQTALRFGIGGNGSTADNQDGLQYALNLQTQYFLYPHEVGDVNFYLGAGPRVGLSYSRLEVSEGEIRQRRTSFGITGRLGVEWFATKSISLLGEYGNELGTRFERREQPALDESSRDYYYRTSVTLGIAAYF